MKRFGMIFMLPKFRISRLYFVITTAIKMAQLHYTHQYSILRTK